MPHVDGLRAVAIATVVVFHAFPNLLPGGYVGVDVFFVISGFLITRLILAEMQAGTFSLPVFFARRVRRLLPAATVTIAAVLVAGALLLSPETYRETGRSAVAAALMFANFLFYRTAGYFSAPPDEKPLLHTWSLSVEDQFYLTWPLLLLLLAPRLSRVALGALTALLLAASLAYAEVKLSANPDAAFYLLLPRAWELLAGCLLAIVAANVSPGRGLAEVLAVVGLAAIVASAVLLTPASRFPGLSALPSVAGTLLLIAAGLGAGDGKPAPLVVRALAWRPVVFLGLISYSLYLWHWPILSLAQFALSRHLAVIETLSAVALAVVAAVLSWRYVEKPFRVHGPLASREAWRTLLVGGAVMGSIALTGGAIRALDGLPQRFDGQVGKVYEDIAHGNPLRSACDGSENAFVRDDICNFGRPKPIGSSYEVAVFGDSNADHLVPMLTKWAAAQGVSGRQVTNSACAPLFDVVVKTRSERDQRACTTYHDVARRFVDANPGLKLVVLSGVWANYHGNIDWRSDGARVPAGMPQLADALARSVAFFRSRGIRVHIVAQIPHFKVMPSRCTVRALTAGKDVAACGRPTKEVKAVLAASNRAIAAVAAGDPGVTVTWPVDILCGPDWCSPMKDGVYLYRDSVHLNAAGSRALLSHFALPELR